MLAIGGVPHATPVFPVSGTGTLVRTVADAQTGGLLIGANVYLPGLQRGAATDIGGRCRIENVPAGTYRTLVTHTGNAALEIDGVAVSEYLPEAPLPMRPPQETARDQPRGAGV